MDAVTERPDDTAPATDTDTTSRRPGRNTALAIIRARHSGWGFPKWRLSSPRAGPATPMPRSS